ncbi:MAG: hypothetical protein Fur0018_07840 [Anaerolineales bacterium]
MMKLLILFPPEHHVAAISTALLQAGYRLTTISSQSNPLSRQTDTLMLGLEEAHVPEAIALARHHLPAGASLRYFVLNVARFESL